MNITKKHTFCLFQGAAIVAAMSAGVTSDTAAAKQAEATKPASAPELFISDLAEPGDEMLPKCPNWTTLACGEEANECSGC